MKNILFLCTGNSCRSQMAEGFCRHYHADSFNCFSAGIEAHGLNPLAIEVMREKGIDISNQRSKTVSELPKVEFDYVVTVCDNADQNCPFFPAKTKKIHIGFEDPAKQNDLSIYRRVRDEIREMIVDLPKILDPES
jgi:arsenate reductase (thioredoxin)